MMMAILKTFYFYDIMSSIFRKGWTKTTSGHYWTDCCKWQANGKKMKIDSVKQKKNLIKFCGDKIGGIYT